MKRKIKIQSQNTAVNEKYRRGKLTGCHGMAWTSCWIVFRRSLHHFRLLTQVWWIEKFQHFRSSQKAWRYKLSRYRQKMYVLFSIFVSTVFLCFFSRMFRFYFGRIFFSLGHFLFDQSQITALIYIVVSKCWLITEIHCKHTKKNSISNWSKSNP